MASLSDDEVLENGGEDGLFGSEEGSVDARQLSDEELDSGDDEDRHDRLPRQVDGDELDFDTRDVRVLDSTIWRHPLPKPVNGEYEILRLPQFLGIEPLAYDSHNFQPPTTDHHSDSKSANFSAGGVASSTVRYRLNSRDQLESNTVVYRWSDGSTTLAIGDQHYVLQSKSLAPPKDSKAYQEVQDSHSYIASPSISSQLLVIIGHLTNQHTIRPNKVVEDDALERLQRGLAAAARGSHKGDAKDGPTLILNTQDPELQKKQAEIAEKERMRAQRRRENAAEKASLGFGRRSGMGGLSVDDLEGRGGRKGPGTGRKPSGAKRPRRRPEYDSDDDLPRGRTREDEYDKEDDFLADSDEELEEGVEDDEEEDILDDDSEKDEPAAKKQKTRTRPDETSDLDADAEADLEDDEAATTSAGNEPANRGRKGRQIIEDDDDE